LKNRKPPSTDLFPSSLLSESQKILGDQFTKLPKKIQTGYTIVFWNHSGLISSNTHNRRTDSFPMDNIEVSRYFTDPRDFRAVNDNGYFLRPKYTRHGAIEGHYVLFRKAVEGSAEYEPTKWIVKTIEAFQGWFEAGVTGSKNGYILDSSIKRFIDAWFIKKESELSEHRGMINSRGDSAKEIAHQLGGAINRNLSRVTKRVNISVFIRINIESLLLHQEQLNYSQKILNQVNAEALVKGSHEWEELVDQLAHIEGTGEIVEVGEDNFMSLGRVKVKNNVSKSLKSLVIKEFSAISINERLVEINKLLATIREEGSNTIPIFYEEVRTGRYTAKNATLQGYHKSVRYAALKGCYEYDINAAHQNILIQLLEQRNLDFPELKVVRDYVKDKQQIRNDLSVELQTPIETVKEIINALTYGAKLSANKKYSLYDICEGDKDLIGRVITKPWLIKLTKALEIAHNRLIGDDKSIKNAVGIQSELLERRSQVMAHLLQGYERLVLDVLIKHSKPKNVALLIHDCIVYYTPKNPSDLSRIVFENTGFDLEFSEEPY
jgi:hypothetical protein